MKKKPFCILVIACFFFGTRAEAADIIPYPSSIQETGGTFHFFPGVNILYNGKLDGVDKTMLDFIRQTHEDYGLSLQSDLSLRATILLSDKKCLDEEGYEMTVSAKSIRIRSSSRAGFFYAFRTLQQLILSSSTHDTIPCLTIKDSPRFSYRGFLIDSGRYYLPAEDIKKAIDIASFYKLNRFHWHLTDDQGWRIEIRKYPLLTEKGAYRPWSSIGNWDQYDPPHYDGTPHSGYYTQEEIRDIVLYAAERNITIVPEIEMLGHSKAALCSYPQFACSFHAPAEIATGMGISDLVFCPKPETLLFLKDILSEVAELFPGEYIHVGADECPKTSWEHCRDCQALIRQEGLRNETALHAWFIQQLEQIADGIGKKLIGWDEILEGGLPLRSTVMSWRGEEGGIQAASLGNDVIMCPSSHCYFDYYQEYPLQAPLSIGSYLPLQKAYSYDPVPEALDENEKKHILGVQGNIWGEFVPNIAKFEYLAFPRLLATAEIGWSRKQDKDEQRFLASLRKEFVFFEKRKINASRTYFRPIIDGNSDIEKGSILVRIQTLCPETEIHYTLDGTEPDRNSPLYSSPVILTESTLVQAILTEADGTILGTPEARNFHLSKATGCSYSITPEPWSLDWYEPKNHLLTDGLKGFVPSNCEWCAISSGTEIIVDLGMITDVNRVRFGTLIAPVNATWPVDSLQCFLSDDGIQYQFAGQAKFSYPGYSGMKQSFDRSVLVGGKKGRYLKLILTGISDITALDEIEVF